MAVEVVAGTGGGGGAEHCSGPVVWMPPRRLGKSDLLTCDRVPDDQTQGVIVAPVVWRRTRPWRESPCFNLEWSRWGRPLEEADMG